MRPARRMATCPSCAHLTAEGQRFCPSCGTVLDTESLPTGTAPRSPSPAADSRLRRSPGPRTPGPPRTPGAASASPAASSGPGKGPPPRFVPGELFSERYRIVALLGRGGMGEVYRADDLRGRDLIHTGRARR